VKQTQKRSAYQITNNKILTMQTTIYNLIIMDESGSMQEIKPQIISGFNETVQTIKLAKEKYPEQNHLVSLVFFNGGRTRIVHDCAPVESIKELSDVDYKPNYNTPLFDAMGFSLTELREKVKSEDKVLVTILTDGLENASNEYTGQTIKKMVEELRSAGWVFAYIGANQDVEKVAFSLSIQNHYSFNASPEGTNMAFEKERESRYNVYDKIHRGEEDYGKDFFGKKENEQNEAKGKKKKGFF